jgi:ubiquinone/menaquinone biosynthesis C-methylase UbiE
MIEWDYSALAAHYDSRADYAPPALDAAVSAMGLLPGDAVADVGAGTGKLARPLAERGLVVHAIEPNAEMRTYGIRNTSGLPVDWRDGRGEQTGLADRCVRAVWFGSSFNVVDQQATLKECRRVVSPSGWFCCLWNHRDLSDPLQARIEDVIRAAVPAYEYGTRRGDPTGTLAAAGLFEDIRPFSSSFSTRMSRAAVMDAWRSHATLARQAGAALGGILDAIAAELSSDVIDVPYTTQGWYARFAG